jgi:solute carrier family 25 carnitine/acylcarnitine transporter 20/29
MQINKKTNYLDSYLKGCVSGMFGITISHPIDTIKTVYQSGIKIKYSFFNLYKGITSPLIGVGLEKALVFGTYQYLRDNNVNVPMSGAISGFIATFIVTPYERLKILKQTSQNTSLLINPIFLYKGFSATFTREVPGFAIYFSTYHYLKEYYFGINDGITKLSPEFSFLFGGLSGSMAWLFIYPQDRIKTIIQSSTNNDKKITTIVKDTYKNGGLKSFYSGFGFAISRAILLHAGTFMMFEFLV